MNHPYTTALAGMTLATIGAIITILAGTNHAQWHAGTVLALIGAAIALTAAYRIDTRATGTR